MKLTVSQANAVNTINSNLQIVACAGSGKTTTMVARILNLLKQPSVNPENIVAVTYSKKAAVSLKQKIYKEYEKENKSLKGLANMYIGTIHGYCYFLLQNYSDNYKNYELLEEVQTRLFMKRFRKEIGIYDVKYHCKKGEPYSLVYPNMSNSKFQEAISAYKTFLDIAREYGVEKLDGLLQTYVKKYEQCLDDKKKFDYTSIMIKTLRLAEKGCFDNYIISTVKHLIVDEYQDVNKNQEYLLYLLSGKYHNLTVVGDDDQCIYGWRGSDVEYMVHFNERYENVVDYSLSRNFRSTPEIVAAANSLIEKNQNRLEKQMYTKNPHGAKPVYNCLPYEKDEAVWIAEQIDAAVSTGKKYADHTVLVRAASQTRALEEAFLAKKIPYKILNGARFYDSEEIRTVLAYLRMVYAPNDLDFLWTIKRPRKGFGKKSIEDLKKYAAEHEIGLFQALGEQIEQGIVKKEVIDTYYKNISELHKEYDKYSCKELVNRVLDFGYREELEQDVEQRRLDNVTELITAIAAMEAENQDKLSLEELLAHFALFTAQDDDDEKNVVKVMTIHTAKGLEFDIVFICGLVDGQFPSRRLRNEDELEEERRLFYVAVTRAKTRLYLSSYAAKSEGFPVRPSAFIQDIDYNLLECVGNVVQNGQTTPQMLPKKTFDVGDKVEHKIFGVGTIVDINLSTQSYEIDFEKLTGTRKIMFRAELKKV